MVLFWPELKDLIHRQKDISPSTEMVVDVEEPFKPRKNRSKSEDFSEMRRSFIAVNVCNKKYSADISVSYRSVTFPPFPQSNPVKNGEHTQLPLRHVAPF
jgi:hypothetical protein